jgi:hypothetical protein
MTEPGKKACVVCERTSDEIPLIPLDCRDSRAWICPQHLPVLIHNPALLAAKLPGADKLTPREHPD